MENAGYFFAAFAIIWAVLFAYVFFLVYKQKQLKHALDSLKERLKESENDK
jgi:CcmD family protein